MSVARDREVLGGNGFRESMIAATAMDKQSIDRTPASTSLLKELEEIHLLEQQNVRQNLAALEKPLQAADLLLSMYQLIFHSLTFARSELDNASSNFLVFLVGTCQRGLVVGMDLLMKGHCIDSFHVLRLSIEAACCAYKGYCDPELIPVWLDSIDSDNNYREAQTSFRKRFSGTEPALDGLKAICDECSTYAHANPFTLNDFVVSDGRSLKVQYLRPEDSQNNIDAAVLSAVDGHWFILALLLVISREYMTTASTLELFWSYFKAVHESSTGVLGDDQMYQSVVSDLVS